MEIASFTDSCALLAGGLGQPALLDEEGRLFLGARDGALGLLLGLLDDPLAFGIDPLRGADLLRDRDPQLVDQIERGHLVDDDIARERQLLPVRDERFEALDEEDDVDRTALLCLLPPPFGAASAIIAPQVPRSTPRSAASSASAAAAGTIAETSPPNVAISLTRLELT